MNKTPDNGSKLLDAWLGMKPINQQLPVQINQISLTHYRLSCTSCSTELPPHMVRGTISKPIGNMITVHAAGFCEKCRELCVSRERIRETDKGLSREFRLPDGSWRVRKPYMPSVLKRLWQLLFGGDTPRAGLSFTKMH